MSELVENVSKKPRRQIRNIHITQLSNYRLPLAGFVSILHRISGFLIFLFLPFLLYLLEQSLVWEKFPVLRGLAANWFVKLIILALSWGYLQHFCSGIRHLVMDLHIGLENASARQSATAVLLVSGVLTLLVALKLFGVF
jgi:succinate dehydrogenase / fumarate reductase cytochrome b subunit